MENHPLNTDGLNIEARQLLQELELEVPSDSGAFSPL